MGLKFGDVDRVVRSLVGEIGRRGKKERKAWGLGSRSPPDPGFQPRQTTRDLSWVHGSWRAGGCGVQDG